MLPAEGACPPEIFARLLQEQSARAGLTLSARATERLSAYLSRLDRARRSTNLTGPLTAAELVDHTLESVAGSSLIPHGARVADIGSGAGFPGLPLAACRADLSLTAVEPRRMRALFLNQAIADIPLENCRVLQGSARSLEPASCDVATCRAVGGLDRVLGTAEFLKPRGLLLAWTTDAEGIGRRLSQLFRLESKTAVPGGREKVIAAYRRA